MGRPPLKFTPDQRKTVKSLAAFGISQKDICRVIGVGSVHTLEKHFRYELDTAAIEANAKVAQSLFKMATSGNNVAAAIFWAKSRMGWQERDKQNLDGNNTIKIEGGLPPVEK